MMLGMAPRDARARVRGLLRERAREHGLSPLADQQIGGGLMLILDAIIWARCASSSGAPPRTTWSANAGETPTAEDRSAVLR
jgi:hypothetical protein